MPSVMPVCCYPPRMVHRDQIKPLMQSRCFAAWLQKLPRTQSLLQFAVKCSRTSVILLVEAAPVITGAAITCSTRNELMHYYYVRTLLKPYCTVQALFHILLSAF